MGADESKPNLKEMSKQTRFSVRHLEILFKSFKVDFPNGTASKAEFVQYYKKIAGVDRDPDWNDVAGNLFNQCDVNQDGKVDFREYMTLLATAANGTREEQLKFAFQLYDQDKNGYITETEFRSVLTALYKSKHTPEAAKKGEEDAKVMVAGMDADKDGKISEWEFMQHAEEHGLLAK